MSGKKNSWSGPGRGRGSMGFAGPGTGGHQSMPSSGRKKMGHQSGRKLPSSGHSGGGARMGKGPMGSNRGYKAFAPPKRNPFKSCFITGACVKGMGLPDDCYELQLLRMFRREYVAKLPDGEAVLAEYGDRAPRVVAAIEALDPTEAQEAWEEIYFSGVRKSVAMIVNGAWDDAYALYKHTCEQLEARYLARTGLGVASEGAREA